MFLLLKNKQQSSLKSAKMQQNSRQLLTTPTRSPYAFLALAKSKASREKLNQSCKANNSTPLNRAFFVRNFRTPQKSGFRRLFSMVGRNRHAYAWLLSLYEQFSHPVTLYRPNREKFSGSSSKFIQGLSAMKRFIFMTTGELRLKITLSAHSREEAERKIRWTSPPICIASNLPPRPLFNAQGGENG